MKQHRNQRPVRSTPPGKDKQANREPDPPTLEDDIPAAGDEPREKDDVAWAPESGDKPEAAPPRGR